MITKETFVINVKDSLKELMSVFKAIFPKNKEEIILLLFLLLVYGSFGWGIANETCIQDCLIKRYDVYLNYDVGMRFHGIPFGHDIAHPLFNLYSTPMSLVLEFFADLYGNYKIKTIGFAMICNLMVSLSTVYIYRYLTEIIKIKNMLIVSLFVLFYAFSFTCLILSFTIESYAFSIFFLSFFVYYYSVRIQDGGKIRFSTNFFFCFVLGGITITNTAKGMIPVFLAKEKFTKALKETFLIGCLLLVCFFAAVYREGLFDFFIERFTEALPEDASEKLFLSGWKSLIGGAVLFPNITTITDVIPKDTAINIGLKFKDYYMYQINAVPFSYVWESIFILLLTVLICIPLFTDFRNKLVQLLFLLFSVDIILHLFLKYGMLDAYIYGGHWVYIVPLLFGWGYKSLGTWKRYTYLGIIGCLFICMLINNYVRLVEFINEANNVWPAASYKW
ncbi:hypothetical protein CLV62_103157 [Dysgonomonas alginatilytica]|uniref:Dolichyl-phosphate-mannose-protein mannosyltransferase n=1 Tax=Dysgonomonas alginatilytica TaxID=1605892 RepID=A0A2V3PUW3_9BACT|nr:DUF6080 domain-containing protein [Dysgonomonas alginatilytica]PXV67484.1 hypothetical protein CLV62_103157 [Dysgonomonas alginatilytica]